jgi:HsdM N-terminal domain
VNGDLNWITNFIWGIADDVLRDLYVRGKYRDVILPMMVLRRLDAVLEPTKKAVLDTKTNLDKAKIANQDAALRAVRHIPHKMKRRLGSITSATRGHQPRLRSQDQAADLCFSRRARILGDQCPDPCDRRAPAAVRQDLRVYPGDCARHAAGAVTGASPHGVSRRDRAPAQRPVRTDRSCACAGRGARRTTTGGYHARAADDAKYPDWKGQWARFAVPLPTQPSHDQTKPWGNGQQAPLTPDQRVAGSSPAA